MWTRTWSALVKHRWQAAQSGAGQLLTFAATIYPIALREYDQIANLVFVSAVAIVVAYAATLSFPSVHPRIESRSRQRQSLLCSFYLMVGTCAGLASAGLYTTLTNHDYLSRSLLWVAVLAFAQGSYVILMGIAVREKAYSSLSRGRFVYGLVLVPLVLIASNFPVTDYGLVLATVLAFFSASAVMLVMTRTAVYWILREQAPVRFYQYCWTQRHAFFSAAISGVAFQAAALIVPALGPYREPWAVLVRIVGGFGTIATQILGPFVDIRLAEGVRAAHRRVVRDAVTRALILGAFVAIGAWSVCFMVFHGIEVGGSQSSQPLFLVLVTVYLVGALVPSVSQNALLMLGGGVDRTLWATLKFAGAVSVLLLEDPFIMLVLLSLLEFGGATAYLSLVARRMSRIRSVTMPAQL